MEFARSREFVVGAYHDLPNVLLTGSLLLGSVTGYRPLVWLSVGLLFFNLPITYIVQIVTGYVGVLQPYFAVDKSDRCATFSDPSRRPSSNLNNNVPVSTSMPILDATGPTWWMTSAFFFFFFTLYNAMAVMMTPNPYATLDQQNNRTAYCYAVIAISVVFLILAGCRLLSGCESLAGGAAGAILGSILAISYWHMLNACGNGLVPDILQIIGNSSPQKTSDVTPVVCA